MQIDIWNVIWRRRNLSFRLPQYNSEWHSVIGLLKTMFSFQNHVLKCVHQSTWHQDTLDQRSIIDSMVISCDLWLYVLDMGQRKWLNCQSTTIWWWYGDGSLRWWSSWQEGSWTDLVSLLLNVWPSPLFGRSSTSTSGSTSQIQSVYIAVHSCGHMDYGGGNPKPTEVKDAIKVEVLSVHVALINSERSWRALAGQASCSPGSLGSKNSGWGGATWRKTEGLNQAPKQQGIRSSWVCQVNG